MTAGSTRLILGNAVVVTVDEARTVHQPGFVAVEEGRLVAIGAGEPPAALRAGAEVIDVGGDILMPGMVNTHCHMAMSVFRGLGDDVADRLERYIFPLEKRFVGPEMVYLGSLHAALELLEGGVTTVADMYYFETEVARAADVAGLRGLMGQTVVDFAAPDAATPEEGLRRFQDLADRLAGHPRLRASIAPHAPYTTGRDLLDEIARRAEKDGVWVQIHLAEVEREIAWCRERYGMTPVRFMAETGLLNPRMIAAHAILVDDADLDLLREGGAAVSHNAGSNAKAGKGIAPVLGMLARGIRVGLGSDGAMSGNTLDLFAQLPQVAKLQKLAARDRTVMPATEVVALATIDGARALGLEREIGSLETGKKADLIRISRRAARMSPLHDVHSTIVYAALASDVRDVMIDGAWVLRDGIPTRFDRAAVIAEVEALAARMRASLGA